MEYLQSLGIIGAILYVAYVFMRRAKTDRIIADLEFRTNKQKEQDNSEINQAIAEAKNAEIRYNNARREYDSITGEESSSDQDPLG